MLETMQALVFRDYGGPEKLRVEVIACPVPKDDEVLVRVEACALNNWDWDMLRGKPAIVRMMAGGLGRPKLNVLGADIAGTVEAVGAKVTRFQPGDAVFGDNSEGHWGGLGEYACAPERLLAVKPVGLNWQDAAALPQAGLLAMQGLRDMRPVGPGDRVLITGGGGGVGTFAIQLAKLAGAHVTAVDHASKANLMASLGADRTLDYTRCDYTNLPDKYDLIVDVVAHHGAGAYARVLNRGGAFGMIGGRFRLMPQIVIVGALYRLFAGKHIGIVALKQEISQLDELAALSLAGDLRPVIDRVYPLAGAADGFVRIRDGLVQGKLIVRHGL